MVCRSDVHAVAAPLSNSRSRKNAEINLAADWAVACEGREGREGRQTNLFRKCSGHVFKMAQKLKFMMMSMNEGVQLTTSTFTTKKLWRSGG